MNCPICQNILESGPDSTYTYYQNVRCPVYQDDKHNNTHYYKYIKANATQIEEISLYPFRIKNIIKSYHTNVINDCYVYKFNPDKFIEFKNIGGGFDRVLHLQHHISPDAEDKLRERIKLLLLLS